MDKLEQVLSITKQIHDTESLLKQLRFELSSIVSPGREVQTRHKKHLADTVIRMTKRPGGKVEKVKIRANRKVSKPKSESETTELIKALLQKGTPIGVCDAKDKVKTSSDRASYILRMLTSDGFAKKQTVQISCGDGKKKSVVKWVAA